MGNSSSIETSYTKEDLENLNKAIFDLQMGKRVVAVWHGDMKVEYATVDLDKLILLKNQVKNSLSGSGRRQVHFCTSKGFS